jgi:hypothetical protein
MSDQLSDEGFHRWWKENWPDLCPTHAALAAWIECRIRSEAENAGLRESIKSAFYEGFLVGCPNGNPEMFWKYSEARAAATLEEVKSDA